MRSGKNGVIKGVKGGPDPVEMIKEGDVVASKLHELDADQVLLHAEYSDAHLRDLVFAVLISDVHGEFHLIFGLVHFRLTLLLVDEVICQCFFDHIRIICREELSRLGKYGFKLFQFFLRS